jgi:hypothetical protein
MDQNVTAASYQAILTAHEVDAQESTLVHDEATRSRAKTQET